MSLHDKPTVSALPGTNRGAALLLGTICGFVAYILCFVIVMSAAPRRPENVRSVVDLPWPVYATFPTYAPLLPVLIFYCFVRGLPARICFLASAVFVILMLSYTGIPLLRRDYIGKF